MTCKTFGMMSWAAKYVHIAVQIICFIVITVLLYPSGRLKIIKRSKERGEGITLTEEGEEEEDLIGMKLENRSKITEKRSICKQLKVVAYSRVFTD